MFLYQNNEDGNCDFKTFMSNEFSDIIIKHLMSHDNDEIPALLLKCSIFGNIRYLWLLDNWKISTAMVNLCCILTDNDNISDNNLRDILKKVEHSKALLPHAFKIANSLQYDSPDLDWESMYLLLNASLHTNVEEVHRFVINEVEILMYDVCVKNYNMRDTVASPYKFATAVNFLALICVIQGRTPQAEYQLSQEIRDYLPTFCRANTIVYVEQVLLYRQH
jgi:hypothetical protein